MIFDYSRIISNRLGYDVFKETFLFFCELYLALLNGKHSVPGTDKIIHRGESVFFFTIEDLHFFWHTGPELDLVFESGSKAQCD